MKLAIASTFRPDVISDDAITCSDPLVGSTSYTPAASARPFTASDVDAFVALEDHGNCVALDDGAPASSREDASLYRSLLTGHAVRVCWGKVAA